MTGSLGAGGANDGTTALDAYYVEPNGTVVELYTDMEHIYDDAREPIVWSEEDSYWVNQWDGLRQPSVGSFGTPPISR